ncbi:MAG TPA: nickel-binding protein [Woeseiaceae bacterium]
MAARPDGMADVFVEWAGRAPDDARSVLEIQEAGCFDLYQLHWQESYIAEEGRHRICHYRAPDAESVRTAFRKAAIDVEHVWTGTLLAGDGASAAGIAVEWPFEAPWPKDPAGALERARREGLMPLGLDPVRAIVPAGCRRILCFCADAAASHSGRLPVPAWRFRHFAR